MSVHGAAAGLGDSVLDLLPEDAEGIKQSRSVVTWDKRKMAYVRHMGGDVLTRGEKRPLQVRVAFVVYNCPLSSTCKDGTWGDSIVETLRCCFFPSHPQPVPFARTGVPRRASLGPSGWASGEPPWPLAGSKKRRNMAMRDVACALAASTLFSLRPLTGGVDVYQQVSRPPQASTAKHGVVFFNEAYRRVIRASVERWTE